VIRYCFFNEFPIGQVGDDKFYFVKIGSQAVEVGPVVSVRFARSRAFYVEYDLCSRINMFGRDITAGFDENLVAAIAEFGDERKNVLLSKRFAPGDLDQITAIFVELLKDVFECNSLAARECILAVAPNTPHRTARQTYKRARPSRMRGLALDRQENFCNAEIHCDILAGKKGWKGFKNSNCFV